MKNKRAIFLVSAKSPWQLTLAAWNDSNVRFVSVNSMPELAEQGQADAAFCGIEMAGLQEFVSAAKKINGLRVAGLRCPILILANREVTFARRDLIACGCTAVLTHPDQFFALAGNLTFPSEPEQTLSLGEYLDQVLPWKDQATRQFSEEYSSWVCQQRINANN
jgi:hypothetical protein